VFSTPAQRHLLTVDPAKTADIIRKQNLYIVFRDTRLMLKNKKSGSELLTWLLKKNSSNSPQPIFKKLKINMHTE